ncbi:hypothetical protein MRX96_026850 [Rhipicephalus microplus]
MFPSKCSFSCSSPALRREPLHRTANKQPWDTKIQATVAPLALRWALLTREYADFAGPPQPYSTNYDIVDELGNRQYRSEQGGCQQRENRPPVPYGGYGGYGPTAVANGAYGYGGFGRSGYAPYGQGLGGYGNGGYARPNGYGSAFGAGRYGAAGYGGFTAGYPGYRRR